MENKVLDQMLSRFSVRAFTDKKIEPEILQQITQAAQQAPNSINGQQISLITIQDKETLGKLADLCGGQAHIRNAAAFILVVADFNRVKKAVEFAGATFGATDSIEGLITGAVDAGITVQALETAAGSFGIGSTVIGALRGNMQGVIDLFNLPKYTVPIVGLTMGYPDVAKLSDVKPRIDKAAYAFAETYPSEVDFKAVFESYDKTIKEFGERVGLAATYNDTVTKMYSNTGTKRDTAATYEKQGFKLK